MTIDGEFDTLAKWIRGEYSTDKTRFAWMYLELREFAAKDLTHSFVQDGLSTEAAKMKAQLVSKLSTIDADFRAEWFRIRWGESIDDYRKGAKAWQVVSGAGWCAGAGWGLPRSRIVRRCCSYVGGNLAFSETLKKEVRRKAHFRCCLCKEFDIEVHHILPEEEGGPDTEDNAAPLCGKCHNIYGANPTKRKMVREARDHWYEICDTRYASDADRLDEIQTDIKAFVASRLSHSTEDILHAIGQLRGEVQAPAAVTREQQIDVDTLVKGFFITKIDAEYAGVVYADWLRELDPDDARWVYLSAQHNIDLLSALKMMRTVGVDVSEGDEIAKHVDQIDVGKLRKVFAQFADICDIPREMVEKCLGDLDSLEEDNQK